jgi:hypothetical protein
MAFLVDLAGNELFTIGMVAAAARPIGAASGAPPWGDLAKRLVIDAAGSPPARWPGRPEVFQPGGLRGRRSREKAKPFAAAGLLE